MRIWNVYVRLRIRMTGGCTGASCDGKRAASALRVQEGKMTVPTIAPNLSPDMVSELVTANRILANEGIVDGFGHISVRHPTDSGSFLLSRSRAPGLIEETDILLFDLEGHPRSATDESLYIERFIHAAIYEARPDVRSIVHSHSHTVIPFSITPAILAPVTNQGAVIGGAVPKWDSREKFGDTTLLVSNMEMGRDLARTLGTGKVCLMRGHGSVAAAESLRSVVYLAIELVVNAGLQSSAMMLGEIVPLSAGEIAAVEAMFDKQGNRPQGARDRAWEHWCYRAKRPYLPST